jgi:hypothetical protein
LELKEFDISTTIIKNESCAAIASLLMKQYLIMLGWTELEVLNLSMCTNINSGIMSILGSLNLHLNFLEMTRLRQLNLSVNAGINDEWLSNIASNSI